MMLCLDIGNTHIFGGVLDHSESRGEPKLTFRMASKSGASSDEYGLFFRTVLRENSIDPSSIKAITMCSVVPEMVYAISASCRKYFDMAPFILQAGVKTGLKIGYQNPLEVGADRIANAIAGTHLHPGKDLMILDLGTATTLCAIGKGNQYKGGVIVPGLRMAMQALDTGTSKLRAVEIVRTEQALGRTTASSIQSGIYLGHLGALKEITARVAAEEFGGTRPVIIATGGFASLFADTGLYDQLVPDLVLQGLKIAYELNVPGGHS